MTSDAATISDTVDTAARMGSLTKELGANILLSEEARRQLDASSQYQLRYLGLVRVKGRQRPVGVWECFDGDPVAVQAQKRGMQDTFAAAVMAYGQQAFAEAIEGLEAVLAHSPDDQVAARLMARARQHQALGVSENWVG